MLPDKKIYIYCFIHTPIYLNIGAGHGRYIPLSTSPSGPSVGVIFLEHHLDGQVTRGSKCGHGGWFRQLKRTSTKTPNPKFTTGLPCNQRQVDKKWISLITHNIT